MLSYQWNRGASIAASLLIAAACSGGESLASPDLVAGADIRLALGGGQSTPVGVPLSSPIVVEVRSSTGEPLAGADVAAEVVTGGTVAPARTRTNGAGRASFQATPGTVRGTYTLRFRIEGSPSATSLDVNYEAVSGPAAQLVDGGGQDQVAPVGTTLREAPRALVTDANGNPVSGVTVRWAVRTGGGQIDAATSTSDSTGRAAMSWTLGAAPGGQTLEASVGATILTFRATGVLASDLVPERLVVVSGDNQTTPAGSLTTLPLVVRVTNSDGSGVANIPVHFVAIGGGSVNSTTLTTTQSGLSSALRTVGGAAGLQFTRATAPGVADTLLFQHQVVAGNVVQALLLGDPGMRAGAPNAVLPDPVTVRALDGFGNPAAGQVVGLTFAGNRGATVPTAPVTDVNGESTFQWRLGPLAGLDTLTVRIGSAAPIRLVASVQATTATTLTASPLAAILPLGVATGSQRVRTVDAIGNPVAGAVVTWSVLSGPAALAAGTSTSNASGFATAPVTATGIGNVILRASLGSASVTMSASSVTPTVSLLAGSSPQNVLIGSATSPVGVRLLGPSQQGIPGAMIEVLSAPTGGTPAAGTRFLTDSAGLAQFVFQTSNSVAGNEVLILGTGARVDTIRLRITGPQQESAIRVVSGGTQTVRLAQSWDEPVVALVTDPDGAVVAGARVAFAILSGGGSLPANNAVTASDGTARVTPTAPTSGTTQVISVRLVDAPSNALAVGTLSASGLPANLIRVTGNNSTGVTGGILPTPLVVQVVDGSGAPLSGITVAWTATGGGSIEPGTSITDGNGLATSQRRLGQTPGMQGTTATVVSAPSISTAYSHLALDASTPSQLELPPGQDGNFQAALAGAPLPNPIQVVVLNAARQPVPGVSVSFSVSTGGGVVSSTSGGAAVVTTDTDGRARALWELGDLVGTQTVTATLPNYPGVASVVVNATALPTNTPAQNYTLVAVGGTDAQSGLENTTLSMSYRIRVLDAFGNPVPGVGVLLSALNGGVSAGLSLAPLGPFAPSIEIVSNANGDVVAWYRTGVWPLDGGGVPVARSLFSWETLVTIPLSSVATPLVVQAFLTTAAP